MDGSLIGPSPDLYINKTAAGKIACGCILGCTPSAHLMFIHRRICLGEQFLHGNRGFRFNTDDTQAERERLSMRSIHIVYIDIALQARLNAGEIALRSISNHDNEFVSTHAANDVRVAKRIGQDTGKLHNRGISSGMAEGIVDVLQAIQVYVQQAHSV